MNHYIQEYIDIVRSGEYQVCIDQKLLCDLIEDEFAKGEIYVDEKQLEKYFSYQKYFPYNLFPWECFVFALHNCTYTAPGVLRWPIAFIYVSRGTGKNGYLSFEDFCLLTDTNGIPKYNIDIFAMAEKQAKASWEDVYDVLETHSAKMKKHFYWTKETIVNTDTKSRFSFNTSSPKTKDGFRPGKVDFDEVHAYESMKLIDVAVTGLGKVPMPRRTYITTDGLVRDCVLDGILEKAHKVLNREIPDNGWLYFLCHIESEDDIHDENAWHKASPSLRYLPNLMQEMKMEYQEYKDDPIGNASFAIKRLNWRLKASEENITSWDNVKSTNQELQCSYNGRAAYAGIDYMSTTDFLSAGILIPMEDNTFDWHTHTWVCKQSRDLKLIKAPIEQWAAAGHLTIVDAAEIPADIPATWIRMKEAEIGCVVNSVAIDKFRYQMVRKALEAVGFIWDKKYGNIHLIRPSNEMQVAPSITSRFVNHSLKVGDNPLFRWAVWNSKLEISKAGNITYGKIEPKSRKTDPFKAYVAAECGFLLDGGEIDIETDFDSNLGEYGVMTF